MLFEHTIYLTSFIIAACTHSQPAPPAGCGLGFREESPDLLLQLLREGGVALFLISNDIRGAQDVVQGGLL